jgi:hypothetical protein
MDQKRLKIALDETRILVLGLSILIGFQFRAPFEERFPDLPPLSQALHGVALACMLITLAFLLTPTIEHRLVEEGRATRRIRRASGRWAALSLLPFALGLGLALFIAVERLGGTPAGAGAGIAAGLLALTAWYGLGYRDAASTGQRERALAERRPDEDSTSLTARIEQMLTEARVVLPGVQALLGFQLAAVLTQAFERLPPAMKAAHAGSLAFITLAMILLITPAAYHRIVYAGEDSEDFHRLGSRLIAAAMAALALGLTGAVFVSAAMISASGGIGALAGLFALLLLVGLWQAYPAWMRHRLEQAKRPLLTDAREGAPRAK